MPEADLLHYRLRWLSGAVYPGAHPGLMAGAGLLFKQHRPLAADSDPRRIDLRASVLDPYRQFRVRAYQQPSRIDVYLLADLSASMRGGKQQTVAALLRVLARSAAAHGDRFGFIGAADAIEAGWLLPAGAPFAAADHLAERLERARLSGGANALKDAAAYLPAARSVVFLLTDSHFPLAHLRAALASAQHHDVVPLLLWPAAEYRDLPAWGLLALRDPESAATRTLVMRPALKARIVAAYARRRQDLLHCFRSFGAEPLFLEHGDVPAINRHLQQNAA